MPLVTRLDDDAGQSNRDGATHHARWRVELDANGGPGTAMQVTGAPRVGRILSTFTGGLAEENHLVCTDVKPSRDADRLDSWILDAEFESRPYIRPNEPTTAPTTEKPEWSVRQVTFREAWREDWYGTLYQDAAGRPFRPQQVDVPGFVILHSRNEDDSFISDPSWLKSINADPFLGFGVHCAQLYDQTFAPRYSDNAFISHFRVTREFHIRFPYLANIVTGFGPSATASEVTLGGWVTAHLNEGFYTYAGSRILDASGLPKVEPTLLTPQGTELAVGGAASYLQYFDFQTMNFGQLGIVLN